MKVPETIYSDKKRALSYRHYTTECWDEVNFIFSSLRFVYCAPLQVKNVCFEVNSQLFQMQATGISFESFEFGLRWNNLAKDCHSVSRVSRKYFEIVHWWHWQKRLRLWKAVFYSHPKLEDFGRFHKILPILSVLSHVLPVNDPRVLQNRTPF